MGGGVHLGWGGNFGQRADSAGEDVGNRGGYGGKMMTHCLGVIKETMVAVLVTGVEEVVYVVVIQDMEAKAREKRRV